MSDHLSPHIVCETICDAVARLGEKILSAMNLCSEIPVYPMVQNEKLSDLWTLGFCDP